MSQGPATAKEAKVRRPEAIERLDGENMAAALSLDQKQRLADGSVKQICILANERFIPLDHPDLQQLGGRSQRSTDRQSGPPLDEGTPSAC